MSKIPIFADIFGTDWEKLPPVLRKHYANRPYSNNRTLVEGTLDVTYKSYIKLLRPFYRMLGSVPIVTERNVPVTVCFASSPTTKAFHFNRTFHFKHCKPYQFHSQILQIQGNEVVEIMRFGICWRMTYGLDGTRVTLNHKGYAFKLFGCYLPLPITPLIGRGNAIETAVDDHHFDVEVTITHPLCGVVYSYTGRFKVTKEV